jgi:molybdenum cofactor cytidylyltransferase
MFGNNSISLGVVILAAGASSRMGQPKMLLPWGKTTVLGHLINLWTRLGAVQTAVACAAKDTAMAAELDRLKFPAANRIFNPEPERGMFSSIQCAARWHGWNPTLTHWAIALGDQPHLRPETLQTVIDFAAVQPGKICQPSRHGRARHPVVLPETAFKKLAVSQDETLKQYLQSQSADLRQVELDDPRFDLDLDRPEDYERARQMYPSS